MSLCNSTEPVQLHPPADTPEPDQSQRIYVYRDGDGSDQIACFCADADCLAFDMAEIAAFSDVLARMTEVNGDTVLTFANGDCLRLCDVPNKTLSAANFRYSAEPVYFLAGSPICTERGDVPVEELRPDDIVWTKDRGWQAIELVVHETIKFTHRDDPAKPILIPEGALGGQSPSQHLIVSPQHRVLQIRPDADEEVLVPATSLVGQNGIRRMRGKKRADYFNIVLERHSIIQAAGCWVESMLVTPGSLSRQTLAARRLLNHAIGMTPARRIERLGVRPRRLKLAS